VSRNVMLLVSRSFSEMGVMRAVLEKFLGDGDVVFVLSEPEWASDLPRAFVGHSNLDLVLSEANPESVPSVMKLCDAVYLFHKAEDVKFAERVRHLAAEARTHLMAVQTP